MLVDVGRRQLTAFLVLLCLLVFICGAPRFLISAEAGFQWFGRRLYGAGEGTGNIPDIVRQDGTTYLLNGLEPNPINTILPSADSEPDKSTKAEGNAQLQQELRKCHQDLYAARLKSSRVNDCSDQPMLEGQVSEAQVSGAAEHEQSPLELNQERVVAGMTLSSVAFQMSLFYLVNHRDADLRRYSYGVIGETISIFCSVLTFNSMYAFAEEYLHDSHVVAECLIFFGVFSSFFIFMEITVMCSSRIRGTSASKRTALHGRKLKIYAHVLNAKTFGACAAQMCGAATIRGFGHLQYMALRRLHSFVLMVLVVPLAFAVLVGLMMSFSWLRAKLIMQDGHLDSTEITWVEVAEECENEVCALCLGFTLSVVIRVLITGTLPHMLLDGFEEGHEHGHEDGYRSMTLLMAAGLGCATISIAVIVINFGHMTSPLDREKLRTAFNIRVLRLSIKAFTMCFAWCTCFSMHILASQVLGSVEGVRFRLFIAVVQSVCALVMILGMDVISDMDCTGPAYDRGIVMLIEALGVSVGLSWEHAFHECVNITVAFMSEDKIIFRATNNPKVWSLLLSGVIVLTVLPAYRLYIVPTRCLLIEEYERAQEEEEEYYRTAQTPPLSPQGEFSPREERTYFFTDDGRPGNRFTQKAGAKLKKDQRRPLE